MTTPVSVRHESFIWGGGETTEERGETLAEEDLLSLHSPPSNHSTGDLNNLRSQLDNGIISTCLVL